LLIPILKRFHKMLSRHLMIMRVPPETKLR
jgi:hypothetical protein